MEWLTWAFGHVCGQGRCFTVGGSVLPVCQRCLGLYLGAALTAGWLIGTGLWRRGLPGRRIFPLHTGILLAAMIGGMHVIDFGPTWRVLCGLWTGHVIIVWMVGGGRELWLGVTGGLSAGDCSSRRHEIHSLAAMAAVTVVGLLIPRFCAAVG